MSEPTIPGLARGECVRCGTTCDGYLCDPCDADVAEQLAARAERDRVEKAEKLRQRAGIPRQHADANLAQIDDRATAALRHATKSNSETPFVYIFGPVGSGKTYAAVAMLKALCAQGIDGYFVELKALIGRIRATYQPNYDGESDWDILERYRTASALVVDDFGLETVSQHTIQVIHDVVNARYQAARLTIFTSNMSMAELAMRFTGKFDEKAGERIVDRMSELSVCLEMTGESRR